MVAKKKNDAKGKAQGSKVEKAAKARKVKPAKEGADEWNTLTAFRNLTRCIGFALLVVVPLVVFRIFPSICFGFFDSVFAALGLAAFFGSIGFIRFTVYGGREPYESAHTSLNVVFGLLYFLVSTFGVVAFLTLMARQPDMGEFYDSFGSTVAQYTKMMPVFGLFTGLTLSYAYSRIFLSKEAKRAPVSAGKERVRLQRSNEQAKAQIPAQDDDEKNPDQQSDFVK